MFPREQEGEPLQQLLDSPPCSPSYTTHYVRDAIFLWSYPITFQTSPKRRKPRRCGIPSQTSTEGVVPGTSEIYCEDGEKVNSIVEVSGNGALDLTVNFSGAKAKYVCAPFAISVTRCFPGLSRQRSNVYSSP